MKNEKSTAKLDKQETNNGYLISFSIYEIEYQAAALSFLVLAE
ncbi:MAG: hypothetical protein ACI9RZ_000174 [Sphingobacteriales bacterium]|jgi:hypothetical protein